MRYHAKVARYRSDELFQILFLLIQYSVWSAPKAALVEDGER